MISPEQRVDSAPMGLGMNGNIKRLVVDRANDRGERQRRRAAVAGVLCAMVSLCTLASSIALDAEPAMTAIGLSAFGLMLSFLCFVVPWDRVGAHLVELAPAAATLAVAVATTTIDPTYGFYLVLVAGFVAFTYRSLRVVGFHLALIGLALLAPVVFEPEATRKAIASVLIFGPGVILVAATAVYVRRTGEARERAYREFANDALELASRIRSRVGPAAGAAVNGPEWFEAPAAPVIPLRTVGIATVVRAEQADEPASTAPAPRRLPVGAVAIAASAIIAMAFTAALARDARAPAIDQRSPTLARDAGQSRSAVDRPDDSARRTGDRSRHRAAPVPAALAATTPAGTATPAPADATGSGGSSGTGGQQAPPASAPAPQAATPVRPQTGEPQPQTPPVPVQQAGPSGPVDAALGVVDQAVGPLVPDLKP